MGALKNGINIGVYCRDFNTAKRFMEEKFNTPDRSVLSPTVITYSYNDGDVVRWIRLSENSRGYKNDIVFAEKDIDKEFVNRYIIPSLISNRIIYFE